MKNLTEREVEVLNLLAEGHSNDEIASSLSVTKSTIKKHLESIFNKLGVYNRVQASVKYVLMRNNIYKL